MCGNDWAKQGQVYRLPPTSSGSFACLPFRIYEMHGYLERNGGRKYKNKSTLLIWLLSLYLLKTILLLFIFIFYQGIFIYFFVVINVGLKCQEIILVIWKRINFWWFHTSLLTSMFCKNEGKLTVNHFLFLNVCKEEMILFYRLFRICIYFTCTFGIVIVYLVSISF